MAKVVPPTGTNRPRLALHVPEPPARPGEEADYSHIPIPAAGAQPRPDEACPASETWPLCSDRRGRLVPVWASLAILNAPSECETLFYVSDILLGVQQRVKRRLKRPRGRSNGPAARNPPPRNPRTGSRKWNPASA